MKSLYDSLYNDKMLFELYVYISSFLFSVAVSMQFCLLFLLFPCASGNWEGARA